MKALGLMVTLAAASVAFAQGDGGGPGGGGGRGFGGNFGPERILGGTIDELKEKLTLTEKQVPQVQAVFDETTQIMQEAIANLQEQGGGGGFQGMREIFNKMRDEQRTALKEALDDTQKAAYDKLLADQDAQRAAGFGRGGRGGRQESPERRKQRLDATIQTMGLNEEQAATIRPLIEKYNELNDARNKAWSDGQAALAKLTADKESTDEALEAALTTMRDAVKAVDKDLKEARGLLKDALTPRQEAQLVVAGFLDK